jgi:hypothetical protein
VRNEAHKVRLHPTALMSEMDSKYGPLIRDKVKGKVVSVLNQAQCLENVSIA